MDPVVHFELPVRIEKEWLSFIRAPLGGTPSRWAPKWATMFSLPQPNRTKKPDDVLTQHPSVVISVAGVVPQNLGRTIRPAGRLSEKNSEEREII